MNITLKDGSIMSFDAPITVGEVAKNISEGLFRVAVCGKVDGKLVDLSTVIDSDCELSIVTLKDKEGLDVYRHTTSHVLAQAVKRLYPNAKFAIGPAIKNGFYYDIDFEGAVVAPEDLEKIEKERWQNEDLRHIFSE